MRTGATWRARVLALARHTVAAAGLGLAWLLISGGPAAASEPAANDPLGAIAAPAPAVPSAGGIVSSALRTTAAPASDPTGTAGALVDTTTAAASSGVQALPDAIAPLTAGPLEPIAPVITPVADSSTAALGDVLGTVGGTVGDVAAGAGDALAPVTQPVLHALQPGVLSTEAPREDGLAVPPVPVPRSDVPADSAVASPDGAAASPDGEPAASDPAGLLTNLVRPAVFAIGTVAAHGSAAADPDFPGPPPAPPLPLTPAFGSLGESSFGQGGGAGGLAGLAASAFGLVLLWRASPRRRPSAVQIPASAAFDPGSTPD